MTPINGLVCLPDQLPVAQTLTFRAGQDLSHYPLLYLLERMEKSIV
jgi:hypothetical protein